MILKAEENLDVPSFIQQGLKSKELVEFSQNAIVEKSRFY